MLASNLSAAPLLMLLPLLACGGAPAASPAARADASSPGARCLAVAGSPRAKKTEEPAKVTVSHILVEFSGAKRAAPTVTRSREEACLRALEARAKLESGASFAEVVKQYSEEPGAATRDGSIGAIARTDVVPPFADAAFELAPGEVSHVVETDFGFHIIQRSSP